MDLKQKKHEWDRKKRTFAASQDEFFPAGKVSPSSDHRWSLGDQTKVDSSGLEQKLELHNQLYASVRRVNMRQHFCFHSNQRGHRIPTFKDL